MRLFAFLACIFFNLSAQAQTFSLPRELAADAFEKAECDNELDEVNKDLEFSGELSDGLKLIELSCWRAAYNFGSIFFAADPVDLSKARLPEFRRLDPSRKIEPTFQITNPSYDEKKKTLESFNKGRGIGDCGTAGEWRWNGKEFVLVRYWIKNNCDEKPFFDGEKPLARFLVYPPKRIPQKKK